MIYSYLDTSISHLFVIVIILLREYKNTNEYLVFGNWIISTVVGVAELYPVRGVK